MYNFLLLLNILKFGISYLFCELPKFQIIKHIHMPVLLNWLRNGHSAIFGLPVIIETEFFLFAFFTFSKWQKQPSVFTYSSLCSFHSCLWTIYFYLSSFHLMDREWHEMERVKRGWARNPGPHSKTLIRIALEKWEPDLSLISSVDQEGIKH